MMKLVLLFSFCILVNSVYCNSTEKITLTNPSSLSSIQSDIVQYIRNNQMDKFKLASAIIPFSEDMEELVKNLLPSQIENLREVAKIVSKSNMFYGFKVETIHPIFFNFFGTDKYVLTGVQSHYDERRNEVLVFGFYAEYKDKAQAYSMEAILSNTFNSIIRPTFWQRFFPFIFRLGFFIGNL